MRLTLITAAKYLLVWLVLAIVAIANGVIRQATYATSFSELTAHQISTVTAIFATGVVVWLFHRRWPFESASQAWAVGLLWLALTIAFEFGFGHYIAGHAWEKLLADYNILNGRVWSLFLAWITAVPYLVFKFTTKAA